MHPTRVSTFPASWIPDNKTGRQYDYENISALGQTVWPVAFFVQLTITFLDWIIWLPRSMHMKINEFHHLGKIFIFNRLILLADFPKTYCFTWGWVDVTITAFEMQNTVNCTAAGWVMSSLSWHHHSPSQGFHKSSSLFLTTNNIFSSNNFTAYYMQS